MPTFLGEMEQLVLLAVLRLGDDAFGVTVQREIEARTRRSVSLGSVYKSLIRLEEKGLVTSFIGEPTPQRGGRRKRCYRMAAAGHRELRDSLDTLRRMTKGLTPHLELS